MKRGDFVTKPMKIPIAIRADRRQGDSVNKPIKIPAAIPTEGRKEISPANQWRYRKPPGTEYPGKDRRF